MTKLDNIMYLLRCLPSRIQGETQYRRNPPLTDAITVVLGYVWSHSYRGSEETHDRPRYRSYDANRSKRNADRPEPMQIDKVRVPSKKGCMRRSLCLRCGSDAHWSRGFPGQPA
ncbi:hypothetical protein PHMEG_00011129 [Phytophthora megakarya]|uniref:Uncharacterized protein n=1 Tax=Phytophthora megakarya TaxID=4795 RepID=A0A225WCY3_9STRA|nr:hypothetical protein PHMEG_00011129 [Phytophthora megakarya]